MQITLVISAPHEQNTSKAKDKNFDEVVEKREIRRISPYPPNFKRIAARIIDPATGAST